MIRGWHRDRLYPVTINMISPILLLATAQIRGQRAQLRFAVQNQLYVDSDQLREPTNNG